MLKDCPICGNTFESYKISQKYCSEECRLERNREYDKLRNREARIRDKAKREKEKIRIFESKQLAKEEAERMHQEEEERKLFELKTKANNGDPKARMELAPRFSAEYWEAYKDMEIENSSRFENSKFVRYVNGVSVYEDGFSDKVMFTIEEEGKILSEMVRNPL